MPEKKKQTEKFLSVVDIDFDKLMEDRKKAAEEKKQQADKDKVEKLERDLNKPKK